MPIRCCLIVALLAASVVRMAAIERKPLPTFPLVALDGTDVASDRIVRDGKWLLVYVRPACIPCDTLLRTIDPGTDPGLADRLIIVVGGDNAGIVKLSADYPKLAGVRWFADTGLALPKALPVAGAPVVFGLRGKMVEWSRTGLAPSAASVKSAMTSWVGRGK
jgi:hypothetical protein